ncbi:hypothetical protein [Paenirhodobacter populi]|uniref:hypothetical protein n=1 Tax=Paenirhodobacter populi TaxID=2306993 RepID=UPI0013E2F047|nr:hypothetical protein [Sinirhodobacter populi]
MLHVRAARDHAGRFDPIDMPFLHVQMTSPEALARIGSAFAERMAARADTDND